MKTILLAFVSNSFHSGLKPTELFFHTVGEHEDMVDTAVVRLPRLGTLLTFSFSDQNNCLYNIFLKEHSTTTCKVLGRSLLPMRSFGLFMEVMVWTYMEAKDSLVNFQRALHNTKAAFSCADKDLSDHIKLKQAFNTIMQVVQLNCLELDSHSLR